MAISLLRGLEVCDLAEMGVNHHIFLSRPRRRNLRATAFAPNIASECSFFHAAMNPCFFKSLERGCLGMRQAGFGTAFGEGPASAACLHEEEFNFLAAHPVA